MVTLWWRFFISSFTDRFKRQSKFSVWKRDLLTLKFCTEVEKSLYLSQLNFFFNPGKFFFGFFGLYAFQWFIANGQFSRSGSHYTNNKDLTLFDALTACMWANRSTFSELKKKKIYFRLNRHFFFICKAGIVLPF